jgi:hypothetical protein
MIKEELGKGEKIKIEIREFNGKDRNYAEEAKKLATANRKERLDFKFSFFKKILSSN